MERENRESKRRVVLMVVLGSVFSLITKMPLTITSLNDLRLIIRKPFSRQAELVMSFKPMTDASVSFQYFCSNKKACVLFQTFGQCMFLLSMCATYHFLKIFDKNFQIAYQQAFHPAKVTNETNSWVPQCLLYSS